MLVFRDGGRRTALRPLLHMLVASCRRALECGDREAVVGALLRAGESECALADAESGRAGVVARATDRLADALLLGTLGNSPLSGREDLDAHDLPEWGVVSSPEGFAYYALHPLDHADAVAKMQMRASRVAVVGIRSIGTTLSAVARAALARRGITASRMTVRPTGHPWDRETKFSAEEMGWVEEQSRQGASFLVVDEGPGLSGSSFLSVAEALAGAGVAAERITLLGSHAAEPARMCARDAAARWAKFQFESVEAASRLPEERGEEISGGEWRRRLLSWDVEEWPASWTAFERQKFLSRDGRRIFKFDGLGHYGEAVRERARVLADLGFSPRVDAAGDGSSAYEFIPGTALRVSAANEDVLRRMAAYCAARAEAMRVDSVDVSGLAQVIEVNGREAFGDEMIAPRLAVERPVIADGRMQPHEWVRGADGAIWKTDSAGHGDDHFFPGPTDIAWDLAGAMVEWEMDAAAAGFFLEEYRRLSGDDAERRIAAYSLAYSLFRLGYSQMAADAMRGSEEEARLRRDAERYRRRARGLREVRVAA